MREPFAPPTQAPTSYSWDGSTAAAISATSSSSTCATAPASRKSSSALKPIAELHKKAESLRSEYVIAVIGRVKLRDASTINPNIPTGEIEVVADELRLLNDSKPLPFSPSDNDIANEEVRLKYRYLDLRRPEMHANIALRHRVTLAIREYLNAQGFYEIETPMMTRSTPEGARDYLVPSRVHPGEFYALPQSPQQFKQILMIAGFDKYFQIARCFRDEDLRADRQPEFTQIDLEMTFARPEGIYAIVEGFLTAAWKTIGVDVVTPFPRMTYDEAIRLYGIDKPDMRLPAMSDVKSASRRRTLRHSTSILSCRSSRSLRRTSASFRAKSATTSSCFSATAETRRFSKTSSAWKRLSLTLSQRFARLRSPATTTCSSSSPAAKRAEVGNAAKSRKEATAVYAAAGQFRLALGQKFAAKHGAFDQRDFRFLWVTDFPMFEWDETEKRWNAAHHPFTSPHEEDMGDPRKRPGRGALARLRRGAQRHRAGLGLHSYSPARHPEHHLQGAGHVAEEQQLRFGYFLEALQYGTPPHGGIALGLDRIVMILAGATSLREVIPFPKTAKAIDLMMDAPTPVSDKQLKELGDWGGSAEEGRVAIGDW